MVIVIIFILIWLTNTDYEKVMELLLKFKNFFIEKDYEFLIMHTSNKSFNQVLKQRYFFSLFTCIVYIILNLDQINNINFIVLVSLVLITYKAQYFMAKNKYKVKLNKAVIEFPYFLNNLCILVQDYPVVNAIYKSIDISPKIFEQDLIILVQDAHNGTKVGIQPYLEFADKFSQVQDIKRIMRTLYSISITCDNKDIIITSLAKIASDKVKCARHMRFDALLDKQALIPWINFLWIGMVIIMFILKMDLSGLAG